MQRHCAAAPAIAKHSLSTEGTALKHHALTSPRFVNHAQCCNVTPEKQKNLILFCNQQFQTLLRWAATFCKPATMAVALALLCSVAPLLLCATLAAGDKTYVLDYSDLGGAPYTVDFDRRSVRLGGLSTAQHNARSRCCMAVLRCMLAQH